MGHHELARPVAGALGCGATVPAVGAAPGDEGVEIRVARLEVWPRVVDHAGERRDRRDVRRAEIDRRLGRAHAALVVAVRGREADLLAREDAAGPPEARTAAGAAD